jgi:two-component system KDP operon response regulator KdpE
VIVVTADVSSESVPLPGPGVEYAVKPFEPDELVALVRQVLAEGGGRVRHMLRAGDIEIDPERGVAVREGFIIPLTPAERSLLKILAGTPGVDVSARDLLVGAWGEDYAQDTDYLALWVARLRQKIEADAAAPKIITGGGDAYRLNAV